MLTPMGLPSSTEVLDQEDFASVAIGKLDQVNIHKFKDVSISLYCYETFSGASEMRFLDRSPPEWLPWKRFLWR